MPECVLQYLLDVGYYKLMRVALVLGPGWYPRAPALGPALLKSFLRDHGHEAIAIDLGSELRNLDESLNRDALAANAAHLERKEFSKDLLERHSRTIDNAIARIVDWRADVVGFTVYSSTWHFSLEMAKLVKRARPDIGIVVGGPEAVMFTKRGGKNVNQAKGLEAIDALVPGEGEIPLLNLLAAYKNGKLQPCAGAFVRVGDVFVWEGDSGHVEDLDSLPFPEFDDYRSENYDGMNELVTYFSRGCIRKCVFCDVEAYWGNWRNRSGARVMAEIEHQLAHYPEVRDFIFCDSILNADVKQLEAFCDLLLEKYAKGFSKIRWRGYAVVRKEMTPELCLKMKAAGCGELWFGVESGSQSVLNSMRKGYTVPVAEAVLRSVHAAGIGTMVLLMMGFPTETEEDFQETLSFVRKNAPHILEVWPSESFTYVGPGTYLDEHAADGFGIDPATEHPIFWKSQGGRNTYTERLKRFEALCACVRECGIRIADSEANVLAEREHLLDVYEDYEIKRAGGDISARPARPSSVSAKPMPTRKPSGAWLRQWRMAIGAMEERRMLEAAEIFAQLEPAVTPDLRPDLYGLMTEAFLTANRDDLALAALSRARGAEAMSVKLEDLSKLLALRAAAGKSL
jgi:radical SAM superfamily enzyme YgiQ (UPF0313 family)